MHENMDDLNTALDEVDASIQAAEAPVQAFALVTERLTRAQRVTGDERRNIGSAHGKIIDTLPAQLASLCERLLANFRELADKARCALDDLRAKIDGLQTSFAQISAAMGRG